MDQSRSIASITLILIRQPIQRGGLSTFSFVHPMLSSPRVTGMSLSEDEDLPTDHLYYLSQESSSENELDSDERESLLDSPRTPRQSEAVFLPSSGPIQSSPIVGSPEQIRRLRMEKGRKKRQQTLQKNAEEKRETEQATRKLALQEVMDLLHSKNLIFWDLLEYIFNPENQQGEVRHREFFVKKHRSTKILDWWLSPQNRGRHAKDEIREWIAKYTVKRVSREARGVTKSKTLQTIGRTIDSQTVKDFDFGKLNSMLRVQSSSGAPFAMRILEAFATSRHSRKHTKNRRTKTNMVCEIPFLTDF